MKFLFVLHDPPYGTERTYNGIRWARQVAGANGNEVKLFLFGDAVGSVMAKQKTPDGYYNISTMLASLANKGAQIGSCGTCLDARGIGEAMLTDGIRRSSMTELSEWTTWADKVINV
jgi:uncharacterized protein involved in oxidation of intracellular sulfur